LNADEMHKNARAAVDEALRINPQLAETQTALANILRNTGDTQGATRAIKNALAANPNYAYAQLIYAYLLDESGDWKGSLVEYERAAKLDPLSPVINDSYAFKLAEVGRFDEALARYKLVDEIEPEYPSAANSIGTIYGLAYGRLDLANLWYRKALALDPGNPWFASILGLVFLELNDDETAEMWIERSLRQAPGFSWAHGAMAMLQSYTQNDELLREHSDAAEQAESRWRQGTTLSHGRVPDLRAGKYETALARYEEKYPEMFSPEPKINVINYRAGIDVAGLFILSGDRDRANVLLDKCEEQISQMIRVGFFGYWISDVQILALRGKQDEALAALRQAYDQNWVTDWRYFFYVDPNLDTIRDTPEFQEIFTLIKEDMAEQLERTHEMETNGEILPVPSESI
jgi:Tfp pilus assembly protein PilF